MLATDWLVLAKNRGIEWLALIALLLLAGALHAQTVGVDCVPIQGQGWQGCAPVGNAQQQQSSAHWESRWGAIVTDAAKGIISVTTDKASKESAMQAVFADCHSRGGTQCKLQTAYDNQCAVIVFGGNVFNVSNAATKEKATELGMQKCNADSTNCHVYYSACSLPVQVQ